MPPTEATDVFRPALILAHGDPRYAAAASDALWLGWDVHRARTGADVCRLAREVSAAVVVLGTGGLDESGWLIAAKLSRELPAVRIFLTDPAPTPELRRFATFVGAAGLVNEHDGVRALLREVRGKAVPAAG